MIILVGVELTRGESFRYEAKGRRDPFVPLIGPDKGVVAGLEDVTSIDDVNLEGIAAGAAGTRIAILNGEMLKEGAKVGVLEVKKISEKTVTLMIGGKKYNVSLPEEGGPKGEE